MQKGWKQLTCTTYLAKQLMDLFKNRQTQFGLDILLRIPTKGNGVEYWGSDLQEFKNFLVDIHSVNFNQ
eukprot:9904746-Ditylum_brightwellii.AAC.1